MFVPKYQITNSILKNISQIEAAKQIVDNSPMLPIYERQFKSDAVIRAVHHSTHIEGNQLELGDAEKIVKGLKVEIAGNERDYNDIINYRNVLKYIDSIQDKKFTKPQIFEVHRIISRNLLEEKYQGIYRERQVVLKNSLTKQISYVPPSYLEVPYLMDDLISWLNTDQDIHPVLVAGLFHCQFVKIHPFADGNGRTARALTTMILYRNNFNINKFFCLDEYYDRNLTSYYKALQSVTEFEKIFTGWLEYFTYGLLEEFITVKQKVLKISRDQKLKSSIGQVYLTDRQERLIEYLQETGRLQNKDFSRIFPEISEDTILRDLKDLIKKKVIRKKGKTKAAYYELKS